MRSGVRLLVTYLHFEKNVRPIIRCRRGVQNLRDTRSKADLFEIYILCAPVRLLREGP